MSPQLLNGKGCTDWCMGGGYSRADWLLPSGTSSLVMAATRLSGGGGRLHAFMCMYIHACIHTMYFGTFMAMPVYLILWFACACMLIWSTVCLSLFCFSPVCIHVWHCDCAHKAPHMYLFICVDMKFSLLCFVARLRRSVVNGLVLAHRLVELILTVKEAGTNFCIFIWLGVSKLSTYPA